MTPPPAPTPVPRPLLGLLALVGGLFHGAWATTVPVPIDWDPAYYRDVARALAQGEGARAGAIWHRLGPELPLPQPADLHWMPLPSRVLVPGLWAWSDHGDQLVTVVLASLWGPLAALLAARLGAARRELVLAGVLGLLGGGYVRFLSTPDSIALYGVLGGLAWLAADRSRGLLAAVLAAAVALTRGDGFLLAPCLGFVLLQRGRPGPAVATAAAGPLAWALWQLRGLMVGGQAVVQMRREMSQAVHIDEVLTGELAGADMATRLAVVLQELGEAVQTALLVGIVLVPVLAWVGAAIHRRRPLVQGVVGYAVLMPVLTLSLAPAIAASGTPFRSGAALYLPGVALAAVAAGALGRLGQERRGYPRGVVEGLVVMAHLLGTLGLGLGLARARPGPLVDCALLAQVPHEQAVFTGRPLELRGACGHRAVLMRADDSAAALQRWTVRHDVRWALLPEIDPDPALPTADDGERLLPGWAQVAPGLWQRPD